MRADGTRVKNISPIVQALPHIMPRRYDAQNWTSEFIDEDIIRSFIREKRKEGHRVTHMSVIAAAYYKAALEHPKVNYFIMNRKVYKRNHFCFSFVILKTRADGTPDETTLKIFLEPEDDVFTISQRIKEHIDRNQEAIHNNGTDKFANIAFSIPGLARLVFGLVYRLDQWGLLPRKIIDLSPFHTSLFITNLASINTSYIFHHCYEFGTTSVFVCMGKPVKAPLATEGSRKKQMPLGIVMDERIATGIEYARFLAAFERYIKNPELLETRLDGKAEPCRRHRSKERIEESKLNEQRERFIRWVHKIGLYVGTLVKWLVVAGVTGLVCGAVGTAFHVGVHEATLLRGQYPWLLRCLPVAGLVIVAFYRLAKTEGLGTNDIIDAVHQGKELPFWLLPSIFVGTVLTHLCGGSAGREGAALQMGGTIGQALGRLFRLDDRDMRIATLCGMAAFFSALFGTPMTAAIFAIMVISIGVLYHAAFVPCLTAALVAYWLSVTLGVEPTRFAVAAPELAAGTFLRVAVLAVLCALVSILFCNTIHFAEHQAKRVKNPWLRVVLGGVLIIVLTQLVGTTDYNGAGMEVITAAMEQGVLAHPAAFALKLLFTAVTLAAGFKGGEVVPSFFVGATFGCLAAPLLGLPAGFGAAVGLVAVFCGATNCPVASTFLSVELFGAEGMLYFALACGISYMLSGYNGLYSSQTILYSKLKAQYINAQTNAHHADEDVETPQTQEKV